MSERILRTKTVKRVGREKEEKGSRSIGIAPGGAPGNPHTGWNTGARKNGGVLISKPSLRLNKGHIPAPASKRAAHALCPPELGPLEVCEPKSIVLRK